MTDTATPETGPVDAPASNESIAAQIAADLETGEAPPSDGHEAIVEEMVKEAESDGGEPSQEEPAAEDDATDPAEDAGDPEEGPPAEEQLVTVKVNGEDREVPLSEALAGYSRLEDYKAKTAEVAEARRQIEAEKSRLEPELKAHFANQLEEATNLFAESDPVLMEARTINWEHLKATDPAAYLQASDTVQARVAILEGMKAKVATARQEAQRAQQQQEQQQQAARFDSAADEIVRARPELADESKFKEFASTNIGFLKELGFQPDEIASSLDHRVLSLADDARQWRAHKAAQATLPQKKVVQKSAVKPLTTDGEGSRASKARFPSNASRDAQQKWIADQILSGA